MEHNNNSKNVRIIECCDKCKKATKIEITVLGRKDTVLVKCECDNNVVKE